MLDLDLVHDPHLWNCRETCRFFGGIHPASLYRGIRRGVFPRPLKIGGSSRWLRSECEAVLARLRERRA